MALHVYIQMLVSALRSSIALSLLIKLLFLAVHNNIICGNPEVQIANSEVIVSGYSTPAVEGTTVTFQCPPGLELVGSNLSTCMDTGEWEPMPNEISYSGD